MPTPPAENDPAMIQQILSLIQQGLITRDMITGALGIPQPEAMPVITATQITASDNIVRATDQVLDTSRHRELRAYQQEAINQMTQDQYRGMGMDVGIGPIPNANGDAIDAIALANLQEHNRPWYIRNGQPEDERYGLTPGQMQVAHGSARQVKRINELDEHTAKYIRSMEDIANKMKCKCDRLYQELEEAYGTINQQDEMLSVLKAKVKELVQPAPLVRAKIDLPLKPYKD